MKKKTLRKLFGTTVLATILCAAGIAVAYVAFYGNALKEKAVIRVYANDTYDNIRTQAEKYLRSTLHRQAFAFYASHLNLERRIKSGYYTFEKGTGVIRMVRKLALGEQTPVKLIIRGARTLPDLAGKLSKQVEADSASLLKAMRSPQLRASLKLGNDSVISRFISNTYEVWWSTSPEKLIARMNREYSKFWNDEQKAKLKRCGLSQYEVMTLASIVYEEVKVADEMRVIAGVFINRLRQGIPLQADPTVKYAVGDFTLRRILYRHLRYDSPFNTYKHRGLPPAPICIPSLVAINAVLDYAKHDYIYFCARPELDGRHNFARTLEEHNVNARKYAEALDKRNIK